MTSEQRTIYIDQYLTGEISSKSELERLLLPPDASLEDKQQLDEEVETQKEIIMAIRARGLREMLQRETARRRTARKWRKALAWTGGGATSFAAAAAIALLVVFTPMSRQMYDHSNQFAIQVQEVSVSRGGLGLLDEAYAAICAGDWKQADKIANDIMCQTPKDATGEQQDEYEQAQWVHVQYLMQTKHPIQARRLLRQIAESGGSYSSRAQIILDSLHK